MKYMMRKPGSDTVGWNKPFEKLRNKWIEVPVGSQGEHDRRRTDDLSKLTDRELLALWTDARQSMTTGDNFTVRGWYQSLYSDVLKDKKVLDVGCGLAFDSITFAQQGARITFMDIVEQNVQIVKRLCRMLGIKNAGFVYMRDIKSLTQLDRDFDAILCLGSLINAPFEVVKEEAQELLKHLRTGGRWIELAYPKKRWMREGRLPFKAWGEYTDGPGTPWMEWYDLPKMLRRLEPAKFDVVLYHEFHNSDFNWFDLIKND